MGYSKEYYQKNKDKYAQRYLDNREAIQEKSKAYYRKNATQIIKQKAQKRRELKLKMLAECKSKCNRCSFTHPAALQFHHIEPSTKSFCLTTKEVFNKPWAEVLDEIAKCELICANCHFIEHYVI